MIKFLISTTKKLIKEWPEIFKDVEVKTIPIVYLDNVIIHFTTGMVWDVDIKNHLDSLTVEDIQNILHELFTEYNTEIKNIEYVFDIDKLKQEIDCFTQRIL